MNLTSLGGAIEAAIWSIYYPIQGIKEGWKSVPYGKPLANQTFHVFDSCLEERPVWVPGELFIGGVGLAKGYLGDEEKTASSFITHPRSKARLYRAGDVGRYLPDGNIELLGRNDSQVKIRGYRVELAEIEHAAMTYPNILDAVVVVQDSAVGARSLLLYATIKRYITPENLQDYLSGHLPNYTLPAHIVFLETMPLSQNGKVDRKQLPAPGVQTLSPQETKPETKTEQIIAMTWQSILRVPPQNMQTNFFMAGGDSFLATRLISAINQTLGIEMPLRTLFENPTPASLAVAAETFLETYNHMEDGEI